MARIMDAPGDAERMGQQGLRERAALTWSGAVERLTAGLSRG
jgi:hypothetical protein